MRLQVPGYERLSQANTLNYSFSGTGVNVTSALAQFGHSGHLVSTLPSNSLGDAAVSHLLKLGISKSYIYRSGDYIRMYFLENGFGTRPGRVTNSSRLESSFNLAPADTYDFKKIAKEIDIAHLCGITLAMNDHVRSQMKRFATEVKNNGGIVVFDCNYRPGLWGKSGYEIAKPYYEEMLYLADIVMMNEKDARFILGMETKESERQAQLMDLIPAVAEKYNIRIAAGTHRTLNSDHTHSLRGYLYKNKAFTFSKTRTFSVLDRIGAGDAYTSGIVYAEIEDFTPEQAVSFATTAGMLAHTVVGDTPMATVAEIFSAMETSIVDIER